MYFITKEEELIGKVIAFTHMAQFADALTIVTQDGGIFIVEQDGEANDKETTIKNKFSILNYIRNESNKWILRELNIKGIITDEDFDAYEREQIRDREEQEKQRLMSQEVQERETYERLKAKFE